MNYHAGINQTDVRNQAGAKKNKKKKKKIASYMKELKL